MPGPAPKDPSVVTRRNDPKKGFRSLPAGGREGDAPAWPLGPDVNLSAELTVNRRRLEQVECEMAEASDGRTLGRLRRQANELEMSVSRLELILERAEADEAALWDELWTYPQAVIWEETFASREVAEYVRLKIRSEQGDLKATPAALARSDRLGLNPMALQKLRTEVEHADEAVNRGEQRRKAATPAKKSGAKKKADPIAAYLSVVSE